MDNTISVNLSQCYQSARNCWLQINIIHVCQQQITYCRFILLRRSLFPRSPYFVSNRENIKSQTRNIYLKIIIVHNSQKIMAIFKNLRWVLPTILRGYKFHAFSQEFTVLIYLQLLLKCQTVHQITTRVSQYLVCDNPEPYVRNCLIFIE